VDNKPLSVVRESTTEQRAAVFKRRITDHLVAVKGIMAEAEQFGLQVAFNVGEEIKVTITKTF